MGGAAGHIKHIWESDLSFSELKEFIVASLKGEIENITEKLDGQNLMVTYKNEKALIARSTKHLKNHAQDALDLPGLKLYFKNKSTPTNVKNAYIEALENFQYVFNKMDKKTLNIFEEGKVWMNIELLCEKTENVIPYGDSQLRIHHLRELDENGKVVRIINDESLDELILKIDVIQIKNSDKTFLIKKTNHVVIQHIHESNKIADKLIDEIEELKSDFNLTDSNNIEDYLEECFRKKIRRYLDDDELIDKLAKRWARNDKSTPINILLKDKSEPVNRFVRHNDKMINELKYNCLYPLIKIFSSLSVTILKNISGIASTNPNYSMVKIIEKVDNTINNISKEISNEEDIEKFKKKLSIISKNFKWFNDLGGNTSVVPLEGIVFQYKDNIYKLTGSFTSILRILSIYRYDNTK